MPSAHGTPDKKNFLIACGGTGGHLSPGIALAEGLVNRGHSATLLISHKKVDTRLAEKYPHLKFLRVPSAPLSFNPVRFAAFGFRQMQGLGFSMNLVRRTHPDGIIGFGGFTTASIILAGAFFRVPVALHEANRVPGRAIRVLSPLARRIYLPPGVRLNDSSTARQRPMGLPVRKEIVRVPRDEAQRSFGLDPQHKVLVVLGGSQGASSLNNWVRDNLAALAREKIQVYCVTGLGKGDGETIIHKSRQGTEIKSIFAPFCDRMGELMCAADLVLTRAGAGTLAELIRCVTPALLVPYPQAADNHQLANARYFEQQGGGVVIDQDRMGGLLREIHDIMFNDWLLGKFQENLVRMDRANSFDQMLDDLEMIASEGSRKPKAPVEPKAKPA